MKKRVVFFLFLFLWGAVSAYGNGVKTWSPLQPDLDEISKFDDKQSNFTATLLEIEKLRFPDTDKAECRRILKKMAAELRGRLTGINNPEEIIRIIGRYVFVDSGFDIDADDPRGIRPENSFLGQTLTRKKGACLGLSLLYLALAEECELPISGVIAPLHFFVAYVSGGEKINIEPLKRGVRRSDKYYVKRFGIARESIQAGVYMKPLTKRSVLGAVLLNAAYFESPLRRREQILKVARTLAPGIPEIYQTLADTYARQGKYHEAEKMLGIVLKDNSQSAMSFALRGLMRLMQDKKDSASDDFNRAFEFDPECAEALAGRLLLYLKLSNIRDAGRTTIRMISILRRAFDRLDSGEVSFIPAEWETVKGVLLLARKDAERVCPEGVICGRISASQAFVSLFCGEYENALSYLKDAERKRFSFLDRRKKIILELCDKQNKKKTKGMK